VGQGAKALAVVAATIASYLPFPLASAAGELALAAMGEQSMEEAAAGIAMGLIPGGKLAKHFKKLTGFVSKMAGAVWNVTKKYVGRAVRFLHRHSPLGLMERAVKWAARKIAGCGCFSRDTLVWTAVGLTAIGDLGPGDLVLTRDDAGEITLREVTAAIVTRDVPLLEVTIRGADGSETTIETTDEHPFRVAGVGERDPSASAWRRADSLRPGDLVVLVAGMAEVASVRFTSRTATVHNLTVEGTSSYFVGEDGVWVHNCRLFRHHWIPQVSDIKQFAAARGIDIEDHTQMIPEAFHRLMHGNHFRPQDYLPRWRRFIAERPSASRAEVEQFVEHLQGYYQQALSATRTSVP
jgi:hypothetical protein